MSHRPLHEAPLPAAAPIAVVVLVVLLVACVGWTAWANVDVIVQGPGRVIPSQQAQVVQSLEGGIVRELLVTDGDIVAAGQIVARLDPTRFASELGEQQSRRASLRERTRRLSAEARGATEIEPETSVASERHAATFAREEAELFKVRRTELEQSLDVIRAQVALREAELRETRSRESRLMAVIALAEQEVAILAPLVRSGTVPMLEHIRLQRELTSLKGELEATRAGIPRAEAAIREAGERIQERLAIFRSTAQRELSEALAQLSSVDETLRAAADRVERSTVRSPVRGVVNRLDVTTLGGVLQPGRTLMEITPLDDVLLVEAHVRPADIAQLQPGMPAEVRLTAHDFALQGSLPAKVLRVGSNTIQDERGDIFYRVVVQTRAPAAPPGHAAEDPIVLPGMQGTVDMRIGTRTVLEYLLKPLARAVNTALRER